MIMKLIMLFLPKRPVGLCCRFLFLAGAVSIVSLLPGCGRGPESRPSIVAIRVNPNPVQAGSNAIVTLSLQFPCEGMSFRWSSSAGSLNPSTTREPTTTFVAPAAATPARISVVLQLDGRDLCSEEVPVYVSGPVSAPSNEVALPPALTGVARIRITAIPRKDEVGGASSNDRIAGKVEGITATNAAMYRVVIYSKTDDWWVQPTAAAPLTMLNEDGTFEEEIHTGSEYAVLLVPESYTNAQPRIPVLPGRGTRQVLEVARVRGRTNQ